MGHNLNKMLDTASRLTGSAVKTAGDLMAKGKDKMDGYSLQNKLAKLQRQLGALVYAQRKAGDKDEEMLSWYIEEIDRVKAQQAELEGEQKQQEALVIYECPSCGSGVQKDAMFCRRCGEKLPRR